MAGEEGAEPGGGGGGLNLCDVGVAGKCSLSSLVKVLKVYNLHPVFNVY